MSSNINKQIRSLGFILQTTGLLYKLSQYKYMQYISLENNLESIVNIKNAQDTKSDRTLFVFFIDSKSKTAIDKIKQHINENICIICSYRSFFYVKQFINTDKFILISMNNIYDINIARVNTEIYEGIKNKTNHKVRHLKIYSFYIDGKYDSLCISKENMETSDWNNLSDYIVVSRYILYMLSKFMSKYFLLEIGKNKQAKEKIENKLKYLKLQLLNNRNMITKKQLDNNE